MRSEGGPVRAYLELCRLSNLPTCFSNVMVGLALGAATGGDIDWLPGIAVACAVSLMYVAGMALNDVIDSRIDAAERPGRPIASGRISRAAALRFAVVSLALGVGLAAIAGVPSLLVALALGATIVAYDIIHKHTVVSVLLMGACRGLVYILAASAVAWPPDWRSAGWLAGAITAYIVVLTLVARVESREGAGGRRWTAILLPAVVLLPTPFVHGGPYDTAILIAAGLAVGWLLSSSRHLWTPPPSVKHAVLGWLAGICLVDAYFLALLGRTDLAIAAGVCFVVTRIGHRHILGT